MKNLIICSLLISGLILVSCNNDKDKNDNNMNNEETTTVTGDLDSDTTSSADSTVDSLSQPMNEDNTGVMPKINSSFYGKDPQGYEVTYNFLGQGKYEKFSFKDNDEKNETGTYKMYDGTVELDGNDGTTTYLKKVKDQEYEVVVSGKKSYFVKEIH